MKGLVSSVRTFPLFLFRAWAQRVVSCVDNTFGCMVRKCVNGAINRGIDCRRVLIRR